MTIKTQNPGIYQTLTAQLNQVARHNRQGSFRTKERYYEAMQQFCKFLSEEYRLQNADNFNTEHDNIMTTIRTMSYIKENRTAVGHRELVEYGAAIIV